MKKSLVARSVWITLISGMLTGMGNGSVFGATMMCFLGRGEFATWGGNGMQAYLPATFTGFIDWAMFVFGFAFIGILVVGLTRHGALESAAQH